ncbi:MAG: hypothetical protein C0501_05235 [Isosphaera sp.]|nr:hypothetical protein [Isosphaera sp.]
MRYYPPAAAALLLAAPAAAHDLQLSVSLPGGEPGVVVLLAAFDDDTPAEGARVTITDAAGAVVAQGRTDEKGVCRLPRPGPGHYKAAVESVGHRDEKPFEVAGSATEFAPERPDKAVGLAVGVGGLLAASAGWWWVRRRRGETGA